MEQINLNNKISNSTKWSVITEIVVKLISPIVNIVLARVLTPEAFGIIATITMVVSFSDIFTDAGFQKYIIQHEYEDEYELYKSVNVAFWTNLCLSSFIWVIIFIFSEPIARLIGSEGNESAIIVACIMIPITAFSSIQMALYKRNLDFKSLFKIRMITSMIPIIITVPLALILKSYWALILGNLVRELINAVLLTLKSPWKPKLHYSYIKLKEMLSFSIWSLFEQISIWLTANIDIIFVGIYLSDYYLGLYKTSMTTVNSYMGIITAATTPVLFSALSRYQNNDKEFKNIFFDFQKYVAILVIPMGVGLFIFSDFATWILLGDQWMEASEFIGLWALTSSFTIIFGHYNSEVYRSKGKPKLSLLSQCIHLTFLIITLAILIPLGFEALYIGRSLIRIQGIITGIIILYVFFKISFKSIIKNVYPIIISSVLMGTFGFLLHSLISDNHYVIGNIISIFLCIIIYFLTLLIFPQMRKDILNLKIIKELKIKIKDFKTK